MIHIARVVQHIGTLEREMVEAYEVAVGRFAELPARDDLRRFLDDHLHHVAQLGAMEAVERDRIHRAVTRGNVILRSLAGDRAVVAKLKKLEVTLERACELALHLPGLPRSLLTVIEDNLTSEPVHHAWLDERLTLDGVRSRIDDRP